MVHRPLVVLAGWLGAQPKNLRRYESLYRNAGCDVISRIAAPYMIVESILRPMKDIEVPSMWPHKTPMPKSYQQLAWDVLAEISYHDSPFIFFHVFSNGGCMLWEQVRRLYRLAESGDRVLPTPVQQRLLRLKAKTVGIVFDSCPGSQLERVKEAAAYCTIPERLEAALYGGMDYLIIDTNEQVRNRVVERGRRYMDSLREDTWDIPQLYMYSSNDVLAPFEDLNKLVDDRMQMMGVKRVRRVVWESSAHCAHLLRHPDEYTNAVSSFLDDSIQLNVRSKL